MGIRKTECRKFAEPELCISRNNGLVNSSQIKYIVRTAVKNIGSHRTLLLHFYSVEGYHRGNRKPEYSVFQQKDDFITLYRSENGDKKWKTACLENILVSNNFWLVTYSAFYSRKDTRRVQRFCGDGNVTSEFTALYSLQEAILCKRRKKRQMAKEAIVYGRMMPIPHLPRNFQNWVNKECLPHYIFYKYERTKKPQSGFCTSCVKYVEVNKPRHNIQSVCPRCGKNIQYKADGRAKKVWDRASVSLIQKISSRELVIRIFKITRNAYGCGEIRHHLWESIRVFLRVNENDKCQPDYFYNNYGRGSLTTWKNGLRPRFSYYQYSFDGDCAGYLYCKNLSDTLIGTPWQYSQIEQFYLYDKEPMEILPYLCAYQQLPAIEYLVKLGFYTITQNIVYKSDCAGILNRDGQNPADFLGVAAKDLQLLQKLDINLNQLALYQELMKMGIMADEKLLVWYQANQFRKDLMTSALKYASPGRLMRYIDKQYLRLIGLKTHYGADRYNAVYQVLDEYTDYLKMGEKLSYNFSDRFVLYPKNLNIAHDQAILLFNERKTEICANKIREAFENLARQFGFTQNGMTIIPPKSPDEIVNEGHALHHCVHSYVERIATGECIILFLRHITEPEEPFFTIEIRDNKVAQIRGLENCAPTPEVEKFMQLWDRAQQHKVQTAA